MTVHLINGKCFYGNHRYSPDISTHNVYAEYLYTLSMAHTGKSHHAQSNIYMKHPQLSGNQPMVSHWNELKCDCWVTNYVVPNYPISATRQKPLVTSQDQILEIPPGIPSQCVAVTQQRSAQLVVPNEVIKVYLQFCWSHSARFAQINYCTFWQLTSSFLYLYSTALAQLKAFLLLLWTLDSYQVTAVIINRTTLMLQHACHIDVSVH